VRNLLTVVEQIAKELLFRLEVLWGIEARAKDNN
jgi:hypothetical protein